MERMAQTALPVIKDIYETQGNKYEKILIPITDGKRVYNVSCDLKKSYETNCKEVVQTFEKSILLHTIDESWKEHLREMDELRHSVQNASYENKDPLLIYKLESFGLFKNMVEELNKKTVSILTRGQIPVRDPQSLKQAAPESKTDYSRYRTQKDEITTDKGASQRRPGTPPPPQPPQRVEPIRVEKKIGRNDPCPCGSGKKYKNCCGQ
jgi:preprotein translocase subunit SecA